jgi:hypothetical protein
MGTVDTKCRGVIRDCPLLIVICTVGDEKLKFVLNCDIKLVYTGDLLLA